MSASALCFCVILDIPQAQACTEIYKFTDTSLNVSAHNFESETGRGLVRFSPSGTRHQSQISGANTPLTWTSAFASVGFNAAFKTSGPGRGSSYLLAGVDGVNTAGLKVGTCPLAESGFATGGDAPLLDVGMLPQYLLDRFGSVADAVTDLQAGRYRVAALDTPARTVRLQLILHDATGASAIVAFRDGKAVVTRDIPAPVFADTDYAGATAKLAGFVGFGGTAAIPGGADAESRFVRAAANTAGVPDATWRDAPVATALSLVQTVAVPPQAGRAFTQWSIVTDLAGRKVTVRSFASPGAAAIDLGAVAATATVESDIDLLRDDLAGDIGAYFSPTAAFSAVGAPAAPDYGRARDWRVLPEHPDKPVDVFFVHPTTYFFPNTWHESLPFGRQNGKVDASIEGQAGVFAGQANVFAPHFRDAHIKALAASEADKEKALALPYDDISKAFDYYLAHYNNGRPFILAGHSQGSNLLLELMEKKFGDAALRQKLVAAYLVGWSVTADDIKAFPFLKMSEAPDEIGAIVSYNTQLRKPAYSIVRTGGIAVNPLTMTTSQEVVPADRHLGAVFFDDTGKRTELPRFTDAQAIDGAAVVSKALESDSIATPFHGFYHSYDYAIFFRNLQKNVGERIAAYLGRAKAAP
jgi:penicillin V acylase-like amidase (Ntn superfamily)